MYYAPHYQASHAHCQTPHVTIRQEATGLRFILCQPYASVSSHFSVDGCGFWEMDLTEAVEDFIKQAVEKALSERAEKSNPIE